jgi:hypothetical protein
MNIELAQALCYGVPQGEKVRVANLRQRGITLTEYDEQFVTSDPGEHISACVLAAKIITREADSKLTRALQDEVAELQLAYSNDGPLGVAINNSRIAMLRVLKEQPDDLKEFVLASLAEDHLEAGVPSIIVDLDAVPGETQKP